MSRYVLRFQGKGAKPREDVSRIAAVPGVAILDETSRMLLVEVPEGSVRRIQDEFPDWVASPEEMIELPDPRYKVGG